MFRGKESLNRIELSRLVEDIEFWCFGLPVALGVGGVCMGVGGSWGCPHIHAHMHVHAHACMINMIISCKWPPPLGESLRIPYDVIHRCVHMCLHVCMCACMHACVHACMCMWVGCTLSPPPILFEDL